MAADQTAAKVATLTLTSGTETIELTGPGRRVELLNHGDDGTVWFAMATTEAGLPTVAGDGSDDEYPLLAGERLTQNVPRGRGANDTIWIAVTGGTATVSAILLPAGR